MGAKLYCTNMKPIGAGRISVWVFLIPTLHFCVCVFVALSGGTWGYVYAFDFPASIIIMVFVWRLDPLFFFGLLGTLWWFFLSYRVWVSVERWRSQRRGNG